MWGTFRKVVFWLRENVSFCFLTEADVGFCSKSININEIAICVNFLNLYHLPPLPSHFSISCTWKNTWHSQMRSPCQRIWKVIFFFVEIFSPSFGFFQNFFQSLHSDCIDRVSPFPFRKKISNFKDTCSMQKKNCKVSNNKRIIGGTLACS